MVRLASLEDMIREMDAEGTRPSAGDVDRLLQHADEGQRVLGFMLRACEQFRAGREQDALRTIREARASLKFLPTILVHNIVWLAARLGREQVAAHECLAFAHDAMRMGYADLALEAASAALILDTMGAFDITRDPAKGREVAGLYETAAERLAPHVQGLRTYDAFRRRRAAGGRGAEPLRVAMVVPNLVDHVVAYTKTVLHLARYADRARYALFVYSSENHAGRDVPLFPTGCALSSSAQRGWETLRELKRRGVEPWLCPTSLHFSDAALAVVEKLVEDRIDVAVFQSGLSAPIDWLAARLSPVPVKAAVHIGSSLFVPGLDVTFFDNPANVEREKDCWPKDGGARRVLRTGTDIAELQGQKPLHRGPFGVPDDAVVIGVLSNHLDRRLSKEYMCVIGDVLRENPAAWFLAFGAGPLPEKLQFFEAAGVADRVRFGGEQLLAGSALKALDIYANEFPVGGSQSVVEAIACGLPVAALRWSDAHPECAGAEIVGAACAVPGPDTAAYTALLNRWVRDADARRAAGRALAERARTLYSVEQYVHELLAQTAEIHARKHSAR
ncbi:MAG: hypothetical protein JXR37_27555 [Kiritimatiellae bacterium]|nr:hypothetical protein [Kiritimatiellia bacterium]